MVVRRPNGKLLLSIKPFYPRGAYRLPTGGIHPGEPVFDALARETHEETGLRTEVRRFLAQIAYRGTEAPDAAPLFHTFAFLLEETGGAARGHRPNGENEGLGEDNVGHPPRGASVLHKRKTAGEFDHRGGGGGGGEA